MTPKTHKKRHKWWREARVYVFLYGIPLVLLFPWTNWRPDADFQASIRTRTVDFTVGHYTGTGMFTGGFGDVDFENLPRVELPGPCLWKPSVAIQSGGSTEVLRGGKVRFRNVALQSLFLPTGTAVRLEWYDQSPTGIRMVVRYKSAPAVEAASVFLDGKSVVEFRSSILSESGAPESGMINVSSADVGAARIYPAEDLRLAISVTPRPQEPGKATTLPVESDPLPLHEGSAIKFLTNDQSSILGFDNALQVSNAERKETVFQGQRLEIAKLRERGEVVALQIDKGIVIKIQARAGTLDVDGRDARPSLSEWLRANKILSTWLATAILVGSAGLTVASRIKLVKLDERN